MKLPAMRTAVKQGGLNCPWFYCMAVVCRTKPVIITEKVNEIKAFSARRGKSSQRAKLCPPDYLVAAPLSPVSFATLAKSPALTNVNAASPKYFFITTCTSAGLKTCTFLSRAAFQANVRPVKR